MKKTRIVCTIGPATESEEMIRKLIKEGMNVARLNTSHGDPETHGKRVEIINKVREDMGVPIAVLLDLEGPKMRTKTFNKEEILLEEGKDFVLTTDDIVGDETKVGITYENLPKDVNPKDIILINDGKIKLEVKSSNEKEIVTKIINGGIITHRRGINVPGVDIKLPALTEKDKKYIKYATKWNVEYVALSFVRKAEDIVEARKFLLKTGNADIPIIAKIETLQAIENLKDIIEVADGIMVARGDLGVEIPVEKVPLLQKKIIELSNCMAKPVITATQMLESMIDNPVPTRAESTDIANAIIDGTDAVMLSAESSIGKYPLEAVRVMTNIALETEKYFDENIFDYKKFFNQSGDPDTNSISSAVSNMVDSLKISTIVATTYNGYTAKAVSRYRKNINIVACSPRRETYNRLALVWGVIPVIMPKFVDTDSMLNNVSNIVKNLGICKKNDKIVVTAGIPYGFSGKTNLIKIHYVQ